MRLARFVLIANAFVFAGAGTAFLLFPDAMAARVGIELRRVSGPSDVRAVFGGLEVAIALLLALAAARDARLRAGLLASASLFGGLCAGRVTSLLLDGIPEAISWVLFGAELAGLVLSLVALRSLPEAGTARAS